MLHEFKDYKVRKELFVQLGCGAFADADPAGCSRCMHGVHDKASLMRAAEAQALQELSDDADDWGPMF